MCVTRVILSFIRFFFFFNDTATTEIYTLSLHDALPISAQDQFAFFWREFEGDLENSSFDRNSQHKSFALFPTADPPVVGVEQYPSAGLLLPGVETGWAQRVFGDELQELRGILLKGSRVGLFRLFLLRVFFHFASGFVILGVGVVLDFFCKSVGIERGLDHFEVFQELQGYAFGSDIDRRLAAITYVEQQTEEGLVTAADFFEFLRVERESNAEVTRPQAVTILSVVATGEGAARTLFVPADCGWFGLVFGQRSGARGEVKAEKAGGRQLTQRAKNRANGCRRPEAAHGF